MDEWLNRCPNWVRYIMYPLIILTYFGAFWGLIVVSEKLGCTGHQAVQNKDGFITSSKSMPGFNPASYDYIVVTSTDSCYQAAIDEEWGRPVSDSLHDYNLIARSHDTHTGMIRVTSTDILVDSSTEHDSLIEMENALLGLLLQQHLTEKGFTCLTYCEARDSQLTHPHHNKPYLELSFWRSNQDLTTKRALTIVLEDSQLDNLDSEWSGTVEWGPKLDTSDKTYLLDSLFSRENFPSRI